MLLVATFKLDFVDNDGVNTTVLGTFQGILWMCLILLATFEATF